MRRFELVDASSSKFWEIEVDGLGLAVTVRFGRIGTQGQAKTKTFGSDAEARKEHDKLVREKTGKGYLELAAASGASPAAPGGAASPASAPAPAAAAAAAAAAAPLVATEAMQVPVLVPSDGGEPVVGRSATVALPPLADDAAATFEEPSGGFLWTDELRAALPALRGVYVPPQPDAEAMLRAPIELPADIGGARIEIAMVNKVAQGQWTYWGPTRSRDLIQRGPLAEGDEAFWTDLCVQLVVARIDLPEGEFRGRVDHHYHHHKYHRYGLQWATEVGVHLRGLPFMTRLLLALAQQWHGSTYYHRLVHSMLPPLRSAVAAADDAAHARLEAVLADAAATTPLGRLLRAHLFPHREDWVQASLVDALADEHFLLAECVMPVESALRYLGARSAYLPFVQAALLLQIRLHEEDAFPLLADMLQRAINYRANGTLFAAFVARMRVPQLLALLAGLMAHKEVRAELERLAESCPAAVLKAVIEHAHASESRDAEAWGVRLALRAPQALALALQALSADSRHRFQMLLAVMQASEAAPDALPAVLRDPPWLRKARAKPLPTVEAARPSGPDRLVWTAGQRDDDVAYEASVWRRHGCSKLSDEDYAYSELRIPPAARPRLLAGGALEPGDVMITEGGSAHYVDIDHVLLLPPAVGLAVWNGFPASQWAGLYYAAASVRAILARFGEAALPGLVNFVVAHPERGLEIALVADCAAIVPVALNALRRLKKARAVAAGWLRAHAAMALSGALVQVFGTATKAEREDAQHGLRWFLANGFEAEARAAAAAHGDATTQALQALIDADPLLVLPARIPKLPPFFVAPALHRPVLRGGGGALDSAAIEHLGTMLAISELDAPYAGLAIVREVCTPESLAAFAWSLFEAWWGQGAPSKEAWAFRALGLLGNDDTARRLTPLIRDWPSEGQHQRAVAGLDVLAAIGSDVALMHLHGIASKAKNKPLQARAQEKVATVAEARDLTPTELADRLVPDLGLDDDGTLRLDFGARAFSVAFDETLKPFVRDAQGVRLKDLPKPLKSDDAALAEAATERYKQMKKDAKAIASLQVMRLETAMVERRRWSAADFRLFFLDHPLMRHLAARLVWGVYGTDGTDGTLLGAFRVAEDFTLADADDATYPLPAEASVGITHVLEMPDALRAAFSQLFADYEIMQPFRQLGRETYTLSAEERLAAQITRYADKVVATGSVLGLANRGWERGRDDSWVARFSRPVGDGLEVNLELDPGAHIADLASEPNQRIPAITLRRAGTWDNSGLVSFGELDPVAASEVLRDADLLAPVKA
jgi:predicted DNA-binding WGR domain protein